MITKAKKEFIDDNLKELSLIRMSPTFYGTRRVLWSFEWHNKSTLTLNEHEFQYFQWAKSKNLLSFGCSTGIWKEQFIDEVRCYFFKPE